MGLLVRRVYFPSNALRIREAALRVGPGSSFYAVTLGGVPVGYASSTVDTMPRELRVQDLMVLDVAVPGRVQRTMLATDVHLTRDLRLRAFDATVGTPLPVFRAAGTVEGDSVLSVVSAAGAAPPETTRVRLAPPLVMATLLPLQLAVVHGLAPGRSFAMRVFDPLWLEERDVTVRVLADSALVVADSARRDTVAHRWVPAHLDTLHAWKVRESYDGVATEAWIDREGRVVRSTAALGLTTQRMPFETAVENWRRDEESRRAAGGTGGAGAVVAATALAAGATPAPDTLDRFAVTLGGGRLADLALSGGRQTLAGDTLTVRREAGVGAVPGQRPGFYLQRLPVLDTALARDLAPEPLIQSTDPRIQAQARLIAGRERRAGPVAQRLAAWVYANVKPEALPGAPSALQVLAGLRGDCNEHTVLYVALARSLGLPARPVSGLVYLHGRFYYHAWPEVWLGTWVAVDPTFGEFPADAAHLRFVTGGLAHQVELLRLIGRVRLTIVGSGS
jgi:transglutaminase-like putative cysteine protease